jgi:ribosomal protein S18 acetylase RimI-like enzyme
MAHILDNPAWNALNSGNKHLSNGDDNVKYFSKEVSPFIGLKEPTESNFQLLYDTLPFAGFFNLISPEEISIPAPWKVAKHIKVLQMVQNKPLATIATSHEIIDLGEHNVPEMLALTQLTNPGPFATRTIDFGYYQGIFSNDELVAMAGQRMNPYQYAEISAVCTHPDHLGKGYAKQLLLNQTQRIKAAGNTPFLHVLSANERAIQVYETMGFETRRELSIYIMEKV